MRRLQIIAHQPSNNTRRMAETLMKAAQEAAAELSVAMNAPLEVGPEAALEADGLILMTTENLGYMSGAMKDWFDRSYYPCLDHTQGMPVAVIIRAGHDGTGTRRALESIMTGLRWRAVQEPLICRGEWQEAFLEDCQALGGAMAAGLEQGIF